jgi:hypothetical protein
MSASFRDPPLEIPGHHSDHQPISAFLNCVHFYLLCSILPASPHPIQREIASKAGPTEFSSELFTLLYRRNYFFGCRTSFFQPLFCVRVQTNTHLRFLSTMSNLLRPREILGDSPGCPSRKLGFSDLAYIFQLYD